MTCPFCEKENVERQKIHETKLCNVIYNIRPKTKGHCLVVPKRHVASVRELTAEEREDIFATVQQVSEIFKGHLQPAGFNYGFNEDAYAGQSVEHFHFHILPRYTNDDVHEFHVFHRDPRLKRNLSKEELKPFLEEFKKIF